jgi:hypothetical protein
MPNVIMLIVMMMNVVAPIIQLSANLLLRPLVKKKINISRLSNATQLRKKLRGNFTIILQLSFTVKPAYERLVVLWSDFLAQLFFKI